MKKAIILVGMVLILLLSACSGSVETDNNTSVVENSEEVIMNSEADPAAMEDEQAEELPESTRLILGTMLLDGEDVVNQAQAGTLLTLWKAYNSLSSSQTTAAEELKALLNQIKGEMTAEQLAAIDAMTFSEDSMAQVMADMGFEMGQGMGVNQDEIDPEQSATRQAMRESGEGPGGNIPGGQGPGGQAPGGQMPAEMDPDQLATLQAQRGSRGNNTDQFMVNALIHFLEEKAAE